MALTENDFNLLRFKLAKLLKTREKRILKIDICIDESIIVMTGFGFFPIKFKNIKEIEDDFKTFYPNEVIPSHLYVFNVLANKKEVEAKEFRTQFPTFEHYQNSIN